MFTAKVYRIMVGSLSGAMEEVYVAKETIRKWNQQNAERTGKVFMPIEWGTSVEAIQNVDVVVGIINNWIENSEPIEEVIAASKWKFRRKVTPLRSYESDPLFRWKVTP